jgi:two-component system, OmpR family, bacitracin resistance response regulator BceR
MFKIFLIEDDVTLYNEIQDRLSQCSYEVFRVTDFSHVIKEFSNVEPDFVIIDILPTKV